MPAWRGARPAARRIKKPRPKAWNGQVAKSLRVDESTVRAGLNLMHADGWFYAGAVTKGAAMSDAHKVAVLLLVLCNTVAATITLAKAQEPAISERERRGLAACLTKCPDGDMKCNNRCISQFQTRGAWSDRARACIRSCRNGHQGATRQAAEEISACSVNCVP